jgi:hypothetical protein
MVLQWTAGVAMVFSYNGVQLVLQLTSRRSLNIDAGELALEL